MQQMKTDMHTHSKGVSLCSHVWAKELVDNKTEQGYDAVVLTNHCQSWYYKPEEHAEYIQKVIDEYNLAKSYGEMRGLKVLLGLEVTIVEPHYADWLLYGVTESFLRQSPCLYLLKQKELFDLCEANGIVLVQAHPFRCEGGPGYVQYMHGVEINCTAGDLAGKDKVIAFANEHNLLITCGTDYHGLNAFRGGTLLPSTIENAQDLAKYLKETDKTHVFLEEERFQFPTPNIK